MKQFIVHFVLMMFVLVVLCGGLAACDASDTTTPSTSVQAVTTTVMTTTESPETTAGSDSITPERWREKVVDLQKGQEEEACFQNPDWAVCEVKLQDQYTEEEIRAFAEREKIGFVHPNAKGEIVIFSKITTQAFVQSVAQKSEVKSVDLLLWGEEDTWLSNVQEIYSGTYTKDTLFSEEHLKGIFQREDGKYKVVVILPERETDEELEAFITEHRLDGDRFASLAIAVYVESIDDVIRIASLKEVQYLAFLASDPITNQ
ncbi:MAG: hypothetical protein IJW46_06450 [Clostridia bacterium]|nr:hypothetical protein [Clostridia bacterium]